MKTKEEIIKAKIREVYGNIPTVAFSYVYDSIMISKIDEMMEEYASQKDIKYPTDEEVKKEIETTWDYKSFHSGALWAIEKIKQLNSK